MTSSSSSSPSTLRSMTGFGRGSAPMPGGTVVVEARAVNHKGLEVKCRLPRGLLAHEPSLVRACKARLERGRIDLAVDLVRDAVSPGGAVVDAARVAAVLAAVRDLSARHKEVTASLSAGELLSLPGVMVRDSIAGQAADHDNVYDSVASDDLIAAVDAAVLAALQGLVQAREGEGRGLVVELTRRKDGIVSLVDQIEGRTQATVVDKAEKLRERLQGILKEFAEPARIVAETAALAERLDVTEELARLRLHIGQLEQLLQTAGSGRRLDFLCQEFLREANTTASKCQDATTAHLVVELKAEIERLREQAQNVE